MRYRIVRARSYEVGIRKLPCRIVFNLFRVMGFTEFYCVYKGKEIGALEELKALINSEIRASRVQIRYLNSNGREEIGTLVTMLIEFIKSRDYLERIK